MRVAAIDIGSNSIRLLVADATRTNDREFAIRTIARAGEPCRLAKGLGETGKIAEPISKKATQLTVEFVSRSRSLGAKRVIIGATAALRDASNGAELAEAIETRVGVPVRILTGDDEARLTYRAVVLGLGTSLTRSACIVFDVGGGSTEVVSGLGDRPGRWTSLPYGAVTLTERFLSSNPPSLAETRDLEQHIAEYLMQHCALFPERTPVLAGVGGTVTVLALLDRGLEHHDPALIEGWAIPRERLEALCDRLLAAPTEQRRAWPAMGEGRADIVAAGVLVVRMLAQRFPSPALHCSTQGLRYGLARLAAEELVDSDGSGPESGPPQG
jgi:exopolyphosphatase/guanosine-5'-triphosphate,3'-diphosphate pyrophosphatase